MDEVLSASCCGSEMEKIGIGISFPDPCKSGSLSDLESAQSYKTFFYTRARKPIGFCALPACEGRVPPV